MRLDPHEHDEHLLGQLIDSDRRARRAVFLLLALFWMVVVVSLAGCGGGRDEDDTELQVCLDPRTLLPASMCQGAGCCAVIGLEPDTRR